MIKWISVKDKMPPASINDFISPIKNYFVLVHTKKRGHMLGIAGFTRATVLDENLQEKEQDRWEVLEYDGQYYYTYLKGGVFSAACTCQCCPDLEDCDGNTLVVTHWAPIDWEDPIGYQMNDNKKGGVTISQYLPTPIEQTFAPHMITNPGCSCSDCDKANEWMKKITPEGIKKVFGE